MFKESAQNNFWYTLDWVFAFSVFRFFFVFLLESIGVLTLARFIINIVNATRAYIMQHKA